MAVYCILNVRDIHKWFWYDDYKWHVIYMIMHGIYIDCARDSGYTHLEEFLGVRYPYNLSI